MPSEILLLHFPALNALRNTYPTAEIVLLGKPWHQQFLALGRCPVDRIMVVPVKKGIRDEAGQAENEAAVDAFVRQMQ